MEIITKLKVIELIIRPCPSFRQKYDNSKNKDLLYVVMGDLAHHILDLCRSGNTKEFKPLCKVIECLHLKGDSYVQELTTIGFLEAVQNIWTDNGINPEEFYQFLNPESKKWWNELNNFWYRIHADTQSHTVFCICIWRVKVAFTKVSFVGIRFR